MLIFVKMQVALGFFVLGAKHAVGRGELGHDQPAAAEIANESPEDSVGHASHWSEDGGRRNCDLANLNRRWDRRAFGGRGARPTRNRVVPELLHSSILPAR